MRRFLQLAAIAGCLTLAVPALAEPPFFPEPTAPAAAVVGGLPAPASPADPGRHEAAEPAKPLPAPPSLVAKVNLSSQRLEVLVDGVSRHTWPISSGRSGYATPRGTYRVQWTARMWHSRKYDWAPMPHAVFFTGGVAIHATSAVGMLGRPASHGCVRLAPANAATFYALVQKHGVKQSQVQVFGSPSHVHVAQRRGRNPDRLVKRANASHTSRPQRVTYISSGSGGAGRDSYVQNGIRYVRVR